MQVTGIKRLMLFICIYSTFLCVGCPATWGGVNIKCHNFHILLIANKLLSLRKICKQTKSQCGMTSPPPVRFYPTPMRGVGVNNSKREGEYSYDPNSILSQLSTKGCKHRRTQGGSYGCNAPTFGFAPIFYFRTQVQGWVQKNCLFTSHFTSFHPNYASPFLFTFILLESANKSNLHTSSYVHLPA